MNQKIIDVTLAAEEDVDTLTFHLDLEQPDAYIVNLNNVASQNDLKNVFAKLLHLLYEEEIQLKLIIPEDYKRDLYIDVCTEYINDLNHELQQVRTSITTELS